MIAWKHFRRGDLVRVEGHRGVWVFMRADAHPDGRITLTVRRLGAASPRYFSAAAVRIKDADARTWA